MSLGRLERICLPDLGHSDFAHDIPAGVDGQAKGYKVVKPKACAALLMNPEKSASAEACLQMLHCLLVDHAKAYANLLLAHQQTLEVRLSICYLFSYPEFELEPEGTCFGRSVQVSQLASQWMELNPSSSLLVVDWLYKS